MKVGDLVQQKKTLFGGPSPILLVIATCRDGETVRAWYAEREWLFRKASLEIVNESR